MSSLILVICHSKLLFFYIIGSAYNMVVTSCIAAQLCIVHDKHNVLALIIMYVHIRTISSLLVWHKTSK